MNQHILKIVALLFSTLLCSSCHFNEENSKWYNVQFESLCGKNNPITASQDDELKYGRNTPYDLQISTSIKFKSVSFKFIEECCLVFDGSANVKNDTLKMQFWNTKKEAPCDCICDYKMTYHINQEKANWKSLSAKMIRK